MIFKDSFFNSVRIEGNFTLSSGKKSNYFYDFEKVHPSNMTIVSELLHKEIKDDCTFEFVVGPAYGGIIPGYIIANFSGSRFIAYDPKNNKFRGDIDRMDGRYIIIDDVISTYGTIDATINAIADLSPAAKCVGVGCFVFRGDSVREELPTYYLYRGEIEV